MAREPGAVSGGSAALTAKLQSLLERAVAITMGRDANTDASALLDESNALWSAIAEHPREMAPLLAERVRALEAELAHAPEEVKRALHAHHEATAAARFDWIEPPRALVAFMMLDAMERIRAFCASK